MKEKLPVCLPALECWKGITQISLFWYALTATLSPGDAMGQYCMGSGAQYAVCEVDSTRLRPLTLDIRYLEYRFSHALIL